MKFTPEVVAALKVLRDNAESDFERHRIDVLERDLTAPPAVEVVDENHQKFDGIEFSKKAKGYMSRDMRLHRFVWEYYFGEIPTGFEVHHIDRNKLNNSPENLQLLSSGEHQKLHRQIRETKKFICIECGREYEAENTGKNKFCSKKCLNTYHRRKHANDERYTITAICEWCGKTFKTTKYTGARFCSQQCISNATYHQLKNNPFIELNANR